MIIDINENIRIRSDVHCWKLERKRTREGVVGYEAYKWFTSLRRALEAACEHEVRGHPARTLAEAATAISRITTRYEKLFDCALAEVSAQPKSRLRKVS